MNVFKERIEEIFRPFHLDEYGETRIKKISRVVFRLRSGVSFDKLVKLSVLLGTNKINVTAKHEEGCPTCGGDNYTPISCDDVKFEEDI